MTYTITYIEVVRIRCLTFNTAIEDMFQETLAQDVMYPSLTLALPGCSK